MRALRLVCGMGFALVGLSSAVRAQNGENGFPAAAAKPAGAVSAASGHTGGADGPSKTQPASSPVSVVPAKTLFGAIKQPAPLPAAAIGGYASGCLAGAKALPVDGKAWQAMRLSRNRNWGHPALVTWIEGFAIAAQKSDGWPGVLVGDMSQPRGGPMLTGHASHQIGLDADIWLTPMPNRRLSGAEREEMSAVSMLAGDQISVDPQKWDEPRARIIHRAAKSAEVERIFVHPAIKKALCESSDRYGPDRSWLSKVRAYWGHHYHFHVRISCPKDSAGCKAQPPPPSDDGCGAELTDWFKRITAPPKPQVGPPKPPPPPVTLDKLPAECRVVLETGVSKGVVAPSIGGAAAALPLTKH